MSKIPKNLSDKDMLKNYHEEESLEDKFMKAEASREKQETRRREHPDIKIAYLTPDIIDSLGKMLLELKVDLYREGIVDYTMALRRDGHKIILEPKE